MTSTPFTLQIPVAALPQIYPAIANIDQTFAPEHVEACCVECGASLTGEELKQLAGQTPLPEKLERVRLEYCARRTCQSRFYRLSVRSISPAAEAALQVCGLALPRTPSRTTGLCSPRTFFILVACTITFFYLLFVLHHLYYGERIPLFQKAHHYY